MIWAALVISAFAAGAINSLAGGGTLLTFPALQALGGLPALMANGTSTLALMPGSLAGGWGYRRELAGPLRDWLWLLLPVSLAGGALGSLLAVGLPAAAFAAVVPWLLLTATLLFLFQPALAAWLKREEGHHLPTGGLRAAVLAFQLLVAVYGGYFGAGIGILMLASLGAMGIGDIHQMNAVKTLLAGAVNLTTAGIFIVAGQVHWGMALAMMAAAIAGGYAGARYGKALPKALVRWLVILIGFAMSGWYFLKG